MIDEIGQDEGGEHADRGTILHAIAEECVRWDRDPYSYVGQLWSYGCIEDMEITEDHADGIDYGMSIIDSYTGKLFIEYRVDLGKWMPGQFGTLDIGIVGKRRIVIFDWKFGHNRVQAYQNEQLMLYALAFWHNVARHHTDATEFELIICQPPAPGGGDQWTCTLDELLAFGKRVKKRAKLTYDEDAERVPGPVQCAYCPGAKTLKCEEYNQFTLAMVVSDFDDLDETMELGLPPRLPSASKLTQERKAYIVLHRDMIEKFLDRLNGDLLNDALRGDPTPGVKAVYGRNPPRKWKKEAEAIVKGILEKLLGDDAYVKKLISPTMAEKELPEKMYAKLKEYIDAGSPKPVLVPEESNKPRVPVLADLFDDIED